MRLQSRRDQEEEEKHMPQPERFEVLVLGSGTGGKLLAWHMAQSGRRTAVVGATLDWRLLSQHRLHAQQE